MVHSVVVIVALIILLFTVLLFQYWICDINYCPSIAVWMLFPMLFVITMILYLMTAATSESALIATVYMLLLPIIFYTITIR